MWLHNTAVPKGKSKKFHKPWEGPFRVVKKMSDVTYRVQLFSSYRKRVVHFDQLKFFKGKVSDEFPNNSGPEPASKDSHRKDVGSSDKASPPVIGKYLVLCDDADDEAPELVITGTIPPSRRYPSCSHHAPARFNDFVSH